MISKELLSEVLEKDAYPYDYAQNGRVLRYAFFESINRKRHINIYELAHKCKEWAISKGYHIESMLYDENVDRKYTSGLAKVLFSDANSNYNEVFYCDESAEQEAIFKACEFILKDKR